MRIAPPCSKERHAIKRLSAQAASSKDVAQTQLGTFWGRVLEYGLNKTAVGFTNVTILMKGVA